MNYRLISIYMLLMFLVSCGSISTVTAPATSDTSLTPFNGSQLSGLSVSCTENMIELECSCLPENGYFFSIPSTANKGVNSEEWQGDENILHLTVGTENGTDIGLVPLPGYTGESIKAIIELNEFPRRVSIPPYTEANSLLEDVFSVNPEPNDQVRLEWVQVNVGDYDFNGEVNVADLVPIAQNWLHSVDTTSDDLTSIPEFWVDGDGNTEINSGDIVPIAQHYFSAVAGYQVTRNSTLLEFDQSAQNPSIISNPTYRFNLPPKYTVIAPGTTVDNWNVIPVDYDGEPGTSIETVVHEAAVLKTNTTISGVGLIGLDGSCQDTLDSGCSLLRIVDPGEIVDGIEIGHGYEHSPGINFHYSLPKDELLYLQVLYYPEVDPITGLMSNADPGGQWDPLSKDGLVVTSIPFVIDRSVQMQRISTHIHYDPNPNGGFYINVTTVCDPPMPQLAPERNGALPVWHAKTTRLDCINGVTSIDLNDDGNFDYSPRLRDQDIDSISLSRTEQLQDYLQYQNPEPAIASITGKVIAYYETDGMIVLQTPTVATSYNTFNLEESLEIRFADNAVFEEMISIDGGFWQRPLNPQALQQLDMVVLEVDLLDYDDSEQIEHVWLRHLLRLTPEEKPPVDG